MTKEEIYARIEELTAVAQDMADNDRRIRLGNYGCREAWHKKFGDEERIYITCRTDMGNLKGSYKCGRVNLKTGEYIFPRWDDVNLITGEMR